MHRLTRRLALQHTSLWLLVLVMALQSLLPVLRGVAVGDGARSGAVQWLFLCTADGIERVALETLSSNRTKALSNASLSAQEEGERGGDEHDPAETHCPFCLLAQQLAHALPASSFTHPVAATAAVVLNHYPSAPPLSVAPSLPPAIRAPPLA